MADDAPIRASYNDIHRLIEQTAIKIQASFQPDLMIAIGGGGFIPARILRTFLRTPGKKNIPIQAIGLSLYEELSNFGKDDGLANAEKLGKEVVRTQWLDHSTLGNQPLLGRKILIVDEVDDSRTTLGYAVKELQKDVEDQLASLPAEKRAAMPPTEFAIFVVHNKVKPKAGSIPDSVKYFSGYDTPDVWIHYPWEQKDILLHDSLIEKERAEAEAAAKASS